MNTTLNNLRATMDLNDLPSPANREAAIDQLFSERAFWLYATGHRLGDLRRLIKVYGRDAESVFPTGDYHKGGNYGPDVNLPIPIEEQNNPNGGACLDRNA
jgi:starch-binding outer membrane protein, SusD/RagB family